MLGAKCRRHIPGGSRAKRSEVNDIQEVAIGNLLTRSCINVVQHMTIRSSRDRRNALEAQTTSQMALWNHDPRLFFDDSRAYDQIQKGRASTLSFKPRSAVFTAQRNICIRRAGWRLMTA